MVNLAAESGFGGFGTIYRGDDQRVLFLRPFTDSYKILKAQLEVLEKEGDLKFVEEEPA
jgi:hypothetical protein